MVEAKLRCSQLLINAENAAFVVDVFLLGAGFL